MPVGAEYKGGLFTPGMVLDEMKSIKNAADMLAIDIRRSKVGSHIKEGFKRFKNEWDEFYDEYCCGISAWASRTLNKTYAKVLEFRDRLNGWRGLFLARGGLTVSPGLPQAQAYGTFNWKWFLATSAISTAVFWYILKRGEE